MRRQPSNMDAMYGGAGPKRVRGAGSGASGARTLTDQEQSDASADPARMCTARRTQTPGRERERTGGVRESERQFVAGGKDPKKRLKMRRNNK